MTLYERARLWSLRKGSGRAAAMATTTPLGIPGLGSWVVGVKGIYETETAETAETAVRVAKVMPKEK